MTYEEAIKYLTETNQLHLIQKELSTDGYTIVALAQHLKDKELDKHSHL